MRIFKTPKQIFQVFWSQIANLPMPGNWRYRFYRMAGIKFNIPDNEEPYIFIGRNVQFDSMYPEDIIIENRVIIATGCIFLSHALDTTYEKSKFYHGQIFVRGGVFIGANSIITKPLTIGKRAIIGAGSIVTHDVPDYQIWAGNPARFIKNRGHENTVDK